MLANTCVYSLSRCMPSYHYNYYQLNANCQKLIIDYGNLIFLLTMTFVCSHVLALMCFCLSDVSVLSEATFLNWE